MSLPSQVPAVTINRRLVVWSPTGAPIVTQVPMLVKSQIEEIFTAAASLPYDDPLDEEPEFEGMSNIEVMAIKLSRHAAKTGSLDAIESVLDRILGKPKQSTETKTMRVTYEDWLREIARQEGQPVSQPLPPAQPYVPDVIDLDGGIFG